MTYAGTIRFIGALALVACALPSCSRYARPRSLETDPAVAEARILARRGVLPRLSIDARASYYADDGARKGTVVMVLERPAKVRFEALTPTDDMLAILTSDGERFVQYERGSNLCNTGDACPENVARLVPIPMRGEDLVDVLLGGTPLIAATKRSLRWDSSDGFLVLELAGDAGVVQEVSVDPCSYELYRSEVLRGGDTVFVISMDGWHDVGGARLPTEIRFEMPERDIDLKLVYRAVDPNVDTDESTFRFTCPEGTVEQLHPCSPEAP